MGKTVATGFFRTLFASSHASTGHICKSCGEVIHLAAIPRMGPSNEVTFRPVFFAVIPSFTTKYRVSNGVIEVQGLFGSLKGSVPLKGAHFSVHGAGLFRLGVGDIGVRGRNSEELTLKNVFRAKAARAELQRLAMNDRADG
ncbi:MAG: hypothetical protein HC794_08070 [Nitrospiraceae bacterium]|nr:hypothetical protein [Nitrospiraceae bacterium]